MPSRVRLPPEENKPLKQGQRQLLRKLGARVRDLRRSRGLTQEDLAEALDLSVAYVSLIERGGRNPPFTTVAAIARALGVTLAVVFAEEG